MQTYELTAHPSTAPICVQKIEARVIGFDDNWLRLRWKIEGAGSLIVPPFAERGRADNLWQATCFEMFLQSEGGEGYSEFNFSPSQAWAAYDFSSVRAGMSDRLLDGEGERQPAKIQPECTMRIGRSNSAIFDVCVPSSLLPQLPAKMGLTAVIEESAPDSSTSRKSYWAFHHGDEKPDFHDPACFIGELAPPKAP